MIRIREGELQVLARAIVAALLKEGFIRAKAEEAVLQRRIVELIVENLQQEQELEAEAERLAERHSRQMFGMDQKRIIDGIKERLAKERGFSL